jgi:hypothetical protein
MIQEIKSYLGRGIQGEEGWEKRRKDIITPKNLLTCIHIPPEFFTSNMS